MFNNSLGFELAVGAYLDIFDFHHSASFFDFVETFLDQVNIIASQCVLLLAITRRLVNMDGKLWKTVIAVRTTTVKKSSSSGCQAH